MSKEISFNTDAREQLKADLREEMWLSTKSSVPRPLLKMV